ncbi:hypothetical protein EJV47_22150 [Hymenobacter gummosus]|uniref:Uncharacterized protein n=1 Tax=Hymenobacter gummosus TaxID=1776032 RepID=A0A431TXH2_9BACT|nr:hypothetical protein [Hymenobacter gummosus]RTQ46235.1 hypothetical protein EJV47_22150 [Hymenobacter gummosus]
MMSRLFPLALLTTLAACSADPAPPAVPETPAAKAVREYRLDYSAPELIDSGGTYYYQRVGLTDRNEPAARRRGYDSSIGSYDDSGSNYETTSFNVAFFGADGADAHLLLPHSRWRVYELDAAPLPAARAAFLFYRLIKADSNQDGQQNGYDPLVLFATDRRGRQLQQVTPDTVSVLSWQVAAPHHLLVHEQHDSDRNRQFGTGDAGQWRRYDLRNLRAPATPLLPDELRATLQQQLVSRRLQLPGED